MKDAALPKPRGRMVDLGGGRRLHGVFAGPKHSSCPLVLLESGAFGFSADWSAVQDKLSAKGIRSLAYDRAGLGFSDPGPLPRDGLAIVADLETFLAKTNEAGPFVACGHSMAGLHVRLFAMRNPARIVGLVLVDATTPEAMESAMVSGFVDQFSKISRLAAWGAGAGLFKPFSGTPLGRRHRAGRRARHGEALGLRGADPQQVGLGGSGFVVGLGASGVGGGRSIRSWPVAVILAGGGGARGGLRAHADRAAEASRAGSSSRSKAPATRPC